MSSEPSPLVSRRQFLTSIGAAGGAGAVVAALAVLGLADDPTEVATASRSFAPPTQSDFTLQGRTNEQSVIIIGAGIAGLTCAYELGKAGYDVTVVEAAERAGGRNWTARAGTAAVDTAGERQQCTFADGLWLNTGPARIAQHHTTLDYCRELGVAVEVFVNANIDAYVAADGVVQRRRSATADLDGYVSELLAKCVSAGHLDEELTSEERTGLRNHLRSVGALGRSDRGYVVPPSVTAGTVGEPDSLEDLLGLGVGSRLAFERDWHQAMPMFHPQGGMDRIVDALLAAVGIGNVQFGVAVEAVNASSTGVTVDLQGGPGRLEADWGICCTAPGVAAQLSNPWPSEVTAALRAPGGVSTGKIGLEYDQRFWETDDHILGGATITHSDIRVLWYPSTGYLSSGGGVIVGAYPFGPAADTFGRITHAEREAIAVRRGAAIHGDRYHDALVSSFSVHWSAVPHIQAAWTSWPDYGSGYALLQQPSNRWLFAGDWLSHTPGWQHGAFESARHAVSTLHELALAG